MSKVLIIDDSEISAKHLSKQLAANYFDVVATKNADEALELIGADFFKVVIIDLVMPNIDCFELCSKIKNLSPFLPIFTTSHIVEDEARIKSIKVGAEDFIIKPFDLELFITRMRACIKAKDDIDLLISRNKHVDMQSVTSLNFNLNSSNIIAIDDDIAEASYINDELLTKVGTLEIKEKISDFSEESLNKAELIIASGYLVDCYGVEICTRIKNSSSTAEKPILLLADQDDVELLEEAFQAGIVDYVASPIDGVELFLKVQRILKRIAIRRNLEGKLSHDLDLAIVDPLTNLYNRRYFDTKTISLIETARNKSQPLSIAIADIDKFKSVNDTYGHLVGDQVLIETAKRIKNITQEKGTTFRFGGEEFIILMENTSIEEASKIAENIRLAMETEPYNISVEPHKINCTLSLGVACLKDTDQNMNDIIKRSDEGLYLAKNSGRNRVVTTN
jgi:two-component system cell cycle response regulator